MKEYYWLILGIILILKDSFILNSIFVLTFGIAAIIIAGLIATNIIAPNNYIAQFTTFAILASIFFMIIFLKRKKHYPQNFQNIIGRKAIVCESLNYNNIGQLKWSGTIVKAKISPKSTKKIFEIGEEVEIESVEGNIFYIKEVK